MPAGGVAPPPAYARDFPSTKVATPMAAATLVRRETNGDHSQTILVGSL
jgi:hypothetical protein